MAVATSVARATVANPTVTEMRAPYTTRLQTSRARLSVPIQNWALGGFIRAPGIDSLVRVGRDLVREHGQDDQPQDDDAADGAQGLAASRSVSTTRANAGTRHAGRQRLGNRKRLDGIRHRRQYRIRGSSTAYRRSTGRFVSDDDRDDDQVDPLDHRIVALDDGLDEELPHAGQAEDALDDHGAAGDAGHLQPEHRDHGDHARSSALCLSTTTRSRSPFAQAVRT